MKLVDCDRNCCGCGACADICPVSAIDMQEDSDGFLYPVIDYKKCISCGKCIRSCGYRHILAESENETCIAQSLSTDLSLSSSGGAAATLEKAFLDGGGIIYGSVMETSEKGLSARHIRVDDPKDLKKLCGSKYVQSSTQGIFPLVQKDLKAGKRVLFTGTPCQVACLRGFLGKDEPNLYCLDIVCHGVPNARLFHEYLRIEGSRRGGTVTDFHFRDKRKGWKLYGSMTVRDKNGRDREYAFSPEASSYYYFFLKSYTYRENCYQCPYASAKRQGDITAGDFWCVDLVHPELMPENGGDLDMEKGVSALVVNNARGRELLNRYGSGIRLWPSSYEKAAKYNGQLLHPSVPPADRGKLWQVIRKDGYGGAERMHRRIYLRIKAVQFVRGCVPPFIRHRIRRMIHKGKEN
ncbi:MAG: Coenzyme F420 hydrogenase/dehydrogenase, beta subunit C-terminal domain [Chordicoccus sp.]